MPLFGKLFAKSYKEYSWLQESAKDFPNRAELTKLFEEVGFDECSNTSHIVAEQQQGILDLKKIYKWEKVCICGKDEVEITLFRFEIGFRCHRKRIRNSGEFVYLTY